MDSRIPLSVVMSVSGQRHAIPHATLTLPIDGAFFSYLASDDTRLPNHPYLKGRGVDPTEYDTYVGEDVWNQPASSVEGSEDDDGDAEGHPGGRRRHVPHDELIFDDVVEWVIQTLEGEDWSRDGVVVCGRCVVADDATWAVPSRSPTVYTPREAFMVMRCSCKFLRDIEAQRKTGGRAGLGEITIAKAMAGSAAKEMRAFVPYRLTRASTHNREGGEEEEVDWHLSEPVLSYAGVSQRHTDVCFPSLMAWTEAEHNEHFCLIMERLRKSRLLERACEENPAFLRTLVSRWAKTVPKGRDRRAAVSDLTAHGFCLFLAVDLLFESASLPIPLLSAKVRLLPAREAEEPSFTGLSPAPYVLEQPNTDNDEAEVADGEDGEDAVGPQPQIHVSESDTDEEDAGVKGSTTTFFRLFRNELNWNHYVGEMEDRWDAAAHDAVTLFHRNASKNGGAPIEVDNTSIPPSVLSDVKVSHYCVVASDASDLFTCGDTLSKRGLPLELLHPELLGGSQEGIDFLKGLSAKLLQETQQHSS